MVLVVALAAVGGCTKSGGSSESGPAATAPTEVTSIDATTPQPMVLGWLGASVEPNVVAAGDRFEVTPRTPVDPTCGVAMAFYTPMPYGAGRLIGVVLVNDAWQPNEPGVSTTLPPCLPPPVSDPVAARVPAELTPELLEVCIDAVTNADGCGLVRVVRPGVIAVDSGGATAQPVVVAPGDEFTITPADDAAPVCDRHELYVAVDGELELVGFPNPSGGVGLPVPGATTTVPRCGAVGGVPSEPVTFVTPDVPDGPYLLCLAYRSERGSCARIEVAS